MQHTPKRKQNLRLHHMSPLNASSTAAVLLVCHDAEVFVDVFRCDCDGEAQCELE